MIRITIKPYLQVGLLCLICLSGVRADVQSPAKETLTIVYDSFAQFIYTEDDQPTGLFVDILNEALVKRLGVPVAFEWQPWQRAQFMVEKDQADGMITFATPDRLVYAEKGDVPVAHSDIAAFTAIDHPRLSEIQQIETLEDLQGFQLLTYLGDGWAKEKLSDLKVDFDGKDIESILEKLKWGRGDIFLQTEDVTQHYIAKLGYNDSIVQVSGVGFGQIEFHLLIGKDSRFLPLLSRLDDTLRAMREDGTIQRLSAAYKHVY